MRKLIVSAALISMGAYAQQPTGPYVGVLGGTADISRDIEIDGELFTYKTDKFTWGAVLGWQLHQNLALEAGYIHPQRIRESIEDGADTYTATLQASAWSASALLTIPFAERWSAHARIGAVRAREKYSEALNGSTYLTASDNTTDILYGVGIGVIVEGARIRLDYQRADFDYGKVGILSLGVNWFLPFGN